MKKAVYLLWAVLSILTACNLPEKGNEYGCKRKEEMLQDLAKNNGLEAAIALLKLGEVDVNAHCKDHGTPLLEAAKRGHQAMVEMLLGQGADTNIKDNYGYTALTWAAERGYSEVASLLLGYGADPNIKNNKGRTALLEAAIEGHPEMVSLLLGRGAGPNIKNIYGYTALIEAAKGGHQDMVKLLLGQGADPNIRDNYGYTALMVASMGGHQAVVEMLLAHEKPQDGRIQLLDNPFYEAIKEFLQEGKYHNGSYNRSQQLLQEALCKVHGILIPKWGDAIPGTCQRVGGGLNKKGKDTA